MMRSVEPFSAACEAQVYGDACTESYFSDGMKVGFSLIALSELAQTRA